jgi:hypothetical protein
MKQETWAGTHPPQALARSPDHLSTHTCWTRSRMPPCGWLVFIPESSACGLGAGGRWERVPEVTRPTPRDPAGLDGLVLIATKDVLSYPVQSCCLASSSDASKRKKSVKSPSEPQRSTRLFSIKTNPSSNLDLAEELTRARCRALPFPSRLSPASTLITT